jgi:hypothetical protein
MAEPTTLFDPEDVQALLQGTERRVGLRFASIRDRSWGSFITSVKDEGDTAWIATIREVSRTGITLSVSQHFEPGAMLIVEQSAKSTGVFCVPVRVVHATPDEKGRWGIGCAFVVPRSAEGPLTSQPSASPADYAPREPP